MPIRRGSDGRWRYREMVQKPDGTRDRISPLKTPTQVRNCLAYVLNHWKHHGEKPKRCDARGSYDPFSSAATFDGWKETEGRRLIVASGWLLSEGWRKRGLISIYFVPGADE